MCFPEENCPEKEEIKKSSGRENSGIKIYTIIELYSTLILLQIN